MWACLVVWRTDVPPHSGLSEAVSPHTSTRMLEGHCRSQYMWSPWLVPAARNGLIFLMMNKAKWQDQETVSTQSENPSWSPIKTPRFQTALIGARGKVSILMSVLWWMDWLAPKARNSALARFSQRWRFYIHVDIWETVWALVSLSSWSLRLRVHPDVETGTFGCDLHSRGIKNHTSGWLPPSNIVYMAKSSSPITDPWGTPVKSWWGAKRWRCHGTQNEHPGKFTASDVQARENGKKDVVDYSTKCKVKQNEKTEQMLGTFWMCPSQTTGSSVASENHIGSGQGGSWQEISNLLQNYSLNGLGWEW